MQFLDRTRAKGLLIIPDSTAITTDVGVVVLALLTIFYVQFLRAIETFTLQSRHQWRHNPPQVYI